MDRPHYFGQFSACYKCTNGKSVTNAAVHSTPYEENKHKNKVFTINRQYIDNHISNDQNHNCFLFKLLASVQLG